MCRVNANVSQLEHLEPLTQMPFNLSFLLSHEWRFSNSPSFLAALVLLSVNQSLIIFYIESAHYNWSTIITSPVNIQTLIVWRHLKQVTVRPHYFWSRITQCGRGFYDFFGFYDVISSSNKTFHRWQKLPFVRKLCEYRYTGEYGFPHLSAFKTCSRNDGALSDTEVKLASNAACTH